MICRAELPELICLTYGYGGRDPKDLAAFVAQYDAVVIDVRLNPGHGKSAGASPS